MEATARQNAKPTATERYWPHVAAGWDGDLSHGIPCAFATDGHLAYVGRDQRDPTAANVAHLDASVARWDGNVAIACRACNLDHEAKGSPNLAGRVPALSASIEAKRASRSIVADQRRSMAVEFAARTRSNIFE